MNHNTGEHVIRMNDPRRYLATVFVILLLPACSTVKPGPSAVEDRSRAAGMEDIGTATDIAKENKGPATGPGVSSATGKASPAIVALMGEADRAETGGNRENAAATLERAIRIEPKNALLWNRLAGLRLRQGKWQQALNLARKSNSLAPGNYNLQLENWQLILEVKQKVRDVQGIRDAQQMIEQLRRKGAGIRG